MKSLLMSLFGLLVFAGAVRGDHISIYADTGGEYCHLSSLVPFPDYIELYIVHKFSDGTAGSQFKVNDASGLYPVAQTVPTGYLSLGFWTSDLVIVYGGECVVGDHVIMKLSFFWLGQPIEGCNNTLDVAAAPTSPIPGEIIVVDCAPQPGFEPASTGPSFYIGPESENCLDPPGSCIPPIPAHTATWGAVKALYR
jgi:hypothetical protein